MLAEEVKTERLFRGYRGTSDTIDRMHKLVQQAKLDPTMHRIATLIRLSVPQDPRGSSKETADAIFNWVKKHGCFQRDQFQIERVEHPISSMQTTIKARQNGVDTNGKLFVGDCDQYGIWVAALGGILGFQYAFETSKSDLERPDEFSHVWAALRVGPEWIAYDASTPRSEPNWRPPITGPDKFKRWPEKEIERTLSGLGDAVKGDVPFMVPREYFGAGDPAGVDDPMTSLEPNPGEIDMLIPPEPMNPDENFGDDYPRFSKEEVEAASHRMSLITNTDTGPHYAPAGRPSYFKVQKRMYPKGSLWNRQEVSRVDRATGEPYFKVDPSTVPSEEVEVGMVSPVTVVERDGRPHVVRRDIRSELILRRPKMHPAGMGATIPTSVAIASGVTAADAGVKAVTESKSVWDTISDVFKSVAPAAADVLSAKYAPKVADATNRVAGGQVITAQAYIQKPWYQQTWVWMGAAVVAAGFGAMVMLKPAKRRRR